MARDVNLVLAACFRDTTNQYLKLSTIFSGAPDPEKRDLQTQHPRHVCREFLVEAAPISGEFYAECVPHIGLHGILRAVVEDVH